MRAQTTGWYRLLVLFLLFASSIGCQSLFKRAKWRPPKMAIPTATSPAGGPTLAMAESAYAQATEREVLGDAACVDYYYQAAALAWPEIERQIGEQGMACGQASELYHSSLTKLISTGTDFCRLDPRQGLRIRTAAGWVIIPTSYHGFPWQPNDFDHLVPVGEYSTNDLNASYRCCGLGVATVAIHCRAPHESFRREQQAFAATVVLRPVFPEEASSSSPFALELFDPLRIASITTAARQVALERDITAPIAYVLSKSDREYLANFFQPGSSAENTGLFMIEPHQPAKIPVVFVHGLLSDPFTWGNLANEIRARPELLERYQIWGYEYSTGEPFLMSAALLRRQLQQVRQQMDPTNSDAALSHVVLVGHSMGGLVSKLQVTHSGNELWEAVSCRPFESIVTTPRTRIQLAESFFFAPSPMVSRVVFVGTPHRGSPWATRPIGRFASEVVAEPSSMQDAHRQLIRDNPNTFSTEFTQRIPTSIDMLESNSQLLLAADRLPRGAHVQFHSIIGSGYRMLCAGDSDKVVPVSSARTPGVISEKLIVAKHTEIHQESAGLDELLCILHKHISDFDLESPEPCITSMASSNRIVAATGNHDLRILQNE